MSAVAGGDATLCAVGAVGARAGVAAMFFDDDQGCHHPSSNPRPSRSMPPGQIRRDACGVAGSLTGGVIGVVSICRVWVCRVWSDFRKASRMNDMSQVPEEGGGITRACGLVF